jgi:hypothetical protein
MRRLVGRFAVWLYHQFTEHDPGKIGYYGSTGATVGVLWNALRESQPTGVACEVRLLRVSGAEPGKLIVTLEVPR